MLAAMAKLLAFCGSIRKQSYNRKLLDKVATEAEKAGAEVQLADLSAFPMPVYNGDLEAESGLPPQVEAFKSLMQDHDGYIIGSPEYNGFLTPLLINTLDWCTRAGDGSGDLSAFADKPVMITSASPGRFGATRSAAHLRNMLGGIGCIVVPYTVSLPSAGNAFHESGELADSDMRSRVTRSAARYVRFVDKHRSGD